MVTVNELTLATLINLGVERCWSTAPAIYDNEKCWGKRSDYESSMWKRCGKSLKTKERLFIVTFGSTYHKSDI